MGQAAETLAGEKKPKHYKVLCISMYNADIKELDGMVEELKRAGYTRANRSSLIRVALESLRDTEANVPMCYGVMTGEKKR